MANRIGEVMDFQVLDCKLGRMVCICRSRAWKRRYCDVLEIYLWYTSLAVQWVSLKLSCHPFLPYLASHPLSLSVILTTSPLAVRAQRNILLTPHYNMILFKFNVVVVEISEFLYFRTLGAVAVGKDGRKIYDRY